MSNNATQAPESQATKRKVDCGNFGNGTYSKVQLELFKDCLRLFKWTPEQAHVTATQFGIDCGQAYKTMIADTVKVGARGKKDSMQSLKASMDSVKIISTYATETAFLVVGIDKLRTAGLIVNDISVKETILELVNKHAGKIQAMTDDEVKALAKANEK